MPSENRRGFTHIELLVVIVIIGILATIAIPKFMSTKNKALVGVMKSFFGTSLERKRRSSRTR